jgi:phage gp36-like protein
MSRATLTQLKQLGLDSYAINQVSDVDKQEALDSASARIDSAVATQKDGTIIQPYPLDIIECECVLASWTLLMANGYNPPASGTDTNIMLRYKEWKDYLVSVSKGELIPKIVTDSSDDGDAPGATGPTVITATTRGYSDRGIGGTFPRPQAGPFSDD